MAKATQQTLINSSTDSGPVECLGMTFENDATRREHFLGLLAEKLKDPEFRKIEGFPIGEDDDILSLSDPPYFTACPNPFLDSVVGYFESKKSSNKYSKKSFAHDVTEGKHDPVYKAHTYHTKVPPKAIRKYIEHYTSKDDIILDPFAGSGMTGVAGRMDEQRCVILGDLAPAATHIAAGYCSKWFMDEFSDVAEQIMEAARQKFASQFSGIESGKCVGRLKYCVWSDVFVCESCGGQYTFADAAVDLDKKEIKNQYQCQHCGAEQSKSSASYATETFFDPILQTTVTTNLRQPFWIVYEVGGKRVKRAINDDEKIVANAVPDDLALSNFRIEKFMFRDDRWGCLFRAGYHKGMTHSHHFYTWRNLAMLDFIWGEIQQRDLRVRHHLRYWFLATAMKCSKLMTYNADGIGRVMKGNLYISSLMQEVNPLHFLAITLRDMTRALVKFDGHQPNVFINTGSAGELPLPNNSIDYAFVDPPFGDNLIYSELNFLWECWLNVFTNEPSETIVNTAFGKSLTTYTDGMRSAFAEIRRTLKAGHWMTVEFHNSKNAVWASLQEALERSGFVIADVRVLDKKHGSIKQVQTTGAVKQDLIISAYKPNGGLENRFKLVAGTEDAAWDFARTHLNQLPVFVEKDGSVEILAERQQYLLFDRMVAFHVQRGVTVPISAGEFYAGLAERFPSRDGMYFHPEQVAEYDKKRVNVDDVVQLELFVNDEVSAIQWLKAQLTEKPQTFQSIQPQFLQKISGWQKQERTLELAELLEQNFLCFEDGHVPSQIHSYLSSNFKELRSLDKTHEKLVRKAKGRWFVPDPRKEADIDKIRQKALLREFDQYLSTKGKLRVVRSEALRAGFKACWSKNDYKTIVELAVRVKDSIVQEDPALLMYYDNALMRTED